MNSRPRWDDLAPHLTALARIITGEDIPEKSIASLEVNRDNSREASVTYLNDKNRVTITAPYVTGAPTRPASDIVDEEIDNHLWERYGQYADGAIYRGALTINKLAELPVPLGGLSLLAWTTWNIPPSVYRQVERLIDNKRRLHGVYVHGKPGLHSVELTITYPVKEGP